MPDPGKISQVESSLDLLQPLDAQVPPSTFNVTPVIYRAIREQRKTAAPAQSSTSPSSPNGTYRRMPLMAVAFLGGSVGGTGPRRRPRMPGVEIKSGAR